MKLTTLLKREWLEPDEVVDAVAALEAGTRDPAHHELLLDAWVQLSPLVKIRPELFEVLCAMPPPLLRRVARRWCASSNDARVLSYAAAIELGGAPALRQIKGAIDRLLLVTFERFEALPGKLRGLAADGLLVRAGARALQRLRPISPEPLVALESRNSLGALLGLFSLVLLAGEEGADAALGNALFVLGPELRAAHLQPRLDVAHRVIAPSAAVPPQFLEAPLTEESLRSLQRPRPVHAALHENLRLAILQAALHAGRVELPEVEPEDLEASEEEEEARSARVRAQLLALEVPADFLEAVRELSWEAAEDVQPLIFPSWSGEESVFDVDHLFGIEHLPALEELHLGMPTEEPEADLSPLRALKHLRRFTWWAQVRDLSPLLEVPSLEHVTLRYDDTDENRAVAAQLLARGVTISSW